MKKYLSALLVAVVVGVAGLASAAPKLKFPKDSKDNPVSHPLYGGYSYLYKNTAAEQMVCTGKCVLSGILMSTGVASRFITLRDTQAAHGGASHFLPPIYFREATDSGALERDMIERPIIMNSGISATISSVLSGESATFLYLDLDE